MRSGIGLVVALLFGAINTCRAADLCLVSSPSTGYNRTTLCQPPGGALNNGWIGYTTDGAGACAPGGAPCLWARSDHGFGAGWSISSSSTDIFENNGPLPPGVSPLYLWLMCAGLDRMAEAEFGLGGTLEVVSFTHPPYVQNLGTSTDLHLTIPGCPTGPLVIGTIYVRDPVAVGAPESDQVTSWGKIRSGYR